MESFSEDFLPQQLRFSECFMKLRVMDEKQDPASIHATRSSQVDRVFRYIENIEHIRLLFLLDLTGSMSNHLEEVKKATSDLYHKIMRTNPSGKLFVSVVGYKDYESTMDLSTKYDVLPFTDSTEDIDKFLQSLSASGGCDDAEDVAGGLSVALRQDWQSDETRTRIMLHIGDAPCHGAHFHKKKISDQFPIGDPTGLEPSEILKGFYRLNVNYYFGKISAATDQMIYLFNSFVPSIDDDFVKVVNLKDPKAFSRVAEVSIRSSISRMASAVNNMDIDITHSGSVSRVGSELVTLVKELPLWSHLTEHSAAIFTLNGCDNVEQIMALCLFQHKAEGARMIPVEIDINAAFHDKGDRSTKGCELYRIKIAPHPFAEGSTRIAYHAMSFIRSRWVPMVLKKFKEPQEDDVRAFSKYFHQAEISWISQTLAREFNRRFSKDPMFVPIYIIVSHVVEVDQRRCIGNKFKRRATDSQVQQYNAETYLPPGQFVKFTNNTGYTNPDIYNKTVAKFSTWTYEFTNKKLMVVDLQGVISKPHGIVLTDPAILCSDLSRFGATNLGDTAMTRCIEALERWQEVVSSTKAEVRSAIGEGENASGK